MQLYESENYHLRNALSDVILSIVEHITKVDDMSIK